MRRRSLHKYKRELGPLQTEFCAKRLPLLPLAHGAWEKRSHLAPCTHAVHSSSALYLDGCFNAPAALTVTHGTGTFHRPPASTIFLILLQISLRGSLVVKICAPSTHFLLLNELTYSHTRSKGAALALTLAHFP